MCHFCNNIDNSDFSPMSSLSLIINGESLNISYSAYSCDSSFEEDFKISYCPICGNKLSQEIVDEKIRIKEEAEERKQKELEAKELKRKKQAELNKVKELEKIRLTRVKGIYRLKNDETQTFEGWNAEEVAKEFGVGKKGLICVRPQMKKEEVESWERMERNRKIREEAKETVNFFTKKVVEISKEDEQLKQLNDDVLMCQLYEKNKNAKVGDNCVCPTCKSEFVKNSYQQKFCRTKLGTECKDMFWNAIQYKENLKRK